MAIEHAYSVIHSFLIAHWLVALGILVASGLFLWKKPGAFINFTLTILSMITVFYIFTIYNESVETNTGEEKDLINAQKIQKSN